jgi:hypothetical protein
MEQERSQTYADGVRSSRPAASGVGRVFTRAASARSTPESGTARDVGPVSLSMSVVSVLCRVIPS